MNQLVCHHTSPAIVPCVPVRVRGKVAPIAAAPSPFPYPAARGPQDMDLWQWLRHEGFPPGQGARAKNGDTPLMRAACRGDDTVVEALLSRDCDPRAVNDEGKDALWFACRQGDPAIIWRLVQAGADIDHANDEGITCLMQAAAAGRTEIAQLLLMLGASPRPVAPDGRRASDMAAHRAQELQRLAQALPHGA